ncbi:Legumain like protein [Argiope bruennichi]|uniref:legumain n=1 Tax=Argiope bruennichi TaxID=94029 RepID=A0A8T0F9B3_ARGBR|nr:Legumain like protein [Argiope bruennichi]
MNFSRISSILLLAFAVTIDCLPRYLETPENGNLWAVLIAGSDTWDNYRHQADVCHAYQILKKHGIPDERIIVFMKDDIANNEANPTPGIIINHPKGNDVYKGVPKDYTGLAVTPKNFMAVLRGDKKAVANFGSGKVLESGPTDHVFVYFADHGAPGLIEFPEGELSAKDLNKTINYMHEKNMYGKMVIYIEACESGSMFEGILSPNIKVYATTASNPTEPSTACYYDEKRETYLGDSYSVHWMEDSDKEVLTKETLQQQYEIVKRETQESSAQEVKQYGDLTIAQFHVSEFQGRKDSEATTLPKVEKDAIRSRDAPIEILKRKYLKSNSEEEQSKLKRKLQKMMDNRLFMQQRVAEIVADIFQDQDEVKDVLENRYRLTNFDCYDTIRAQFNEECFRLSKNAFALDFMYVLVNLCEKRVSPHSAIAAMERVCVHPPVYGIH